jgi:hypothetical protein
MSECNEQTGEADRETIRARADLRYLARTSPPIPDALMQEAHRLIEATRETRDSELAVAGIIGRKQTWRWNAW